MPISPERLRRNAVHEASHAVVAYAIGARVTELSIVPGPVAEGSCLVAPPPPVGEAYRAFAAAGDVGVELLEVLDCVAGASVPRTTVGAWAERLQPATEAAFARELAAARANPVFLDSQKLALDAHTDPVVQRGRVAAARLRAREILRANWSAVVAIADALLEHGELVAGARGLTSRSGLAVPGSSSRAAVKAAAPSPVRFIEHSSQGLPVPRGAAAGVKARSRLPLARVIPQGMRVWA